MVKFIAHRGNINGPDHDNENKEEYLKYAYHLGYDVEVDIWAHRGLLYYGHDEPSDIADTGFLQLTGVWNHAKNLEALEILMSMRTNCFWHQEDSVTLTSKNYIWCYPGIFVRKKNAIWLDLLGKPLPSNINGIYGVCGDYKDVRCDTN